MEQPASAVAGGEDGPAFEDVAGRGHDLSLTVDRGDGHARGHDHPPIHDPDRERGPAVIGHELAEDVAERLAAVVRERLGR